MDIYPIVILIAEVSRNKSFVFQRIGRHYSSGYALFCLFIQLGYAAYALFLFLVFRPPDRKRCSPESASGKVPVLKILQPFAKSSGSGAFRFPVNLLVELYHLIPYGSCLDEPAVQRIVEDRLVRPPAMRIGVYVLFYLECLALHLHLNAYINVKSLSIRGERCVVRVFHISSGKFQVLVLYTCFYKFFIQILNLEELSGTVHHRTPYALFVLEGKRSNVVLFAHAVIVCTECRGNVNYSCSFFRRNEISADHSHCILFRKYPRQQLAIVYALKIAALEAVQNLVRNQLVSRFVIAEGNRGSLWIEVGSQQFLCNNVNSWLSAIWVERSHPRIFYVRAYAERHVGRKCPWSCGPCNEEQLPLFHLCILRHCSVRFYSLEQESALAILLYLELDCGRCIFNIAVAARLV